MDKNNKIKESIKATREKRAAQKIFVRELKIDLDKCNQDTTSYFNDLMTEAKWIKNNAIQQKSISDMKDNLKVVPIRYLKDGELVEENRKLTRTGSQIQQIMINQVKANITGLSTKKKKGMKIGGIKFIKQVDSVSFIQERNAYHLRYNEKEEITHIKLTKNKQWIKVIGGHQFVGIDETAGVKLVRKASGWYLHVTCCLAQARFEEWKQSFSKTEVIKKEAVAVDLGIKTTASWSDNSDPQNRGMVDIKIQEPNKLKQIQRKMAKLLIKIKKTDEYKQNNKFRTNGYIKLIQLLRKEYEKLVNRRKSKALQFVAFLTKRYRTVVFQDEQIRGWHKGLFGKPVQNSALGTIKSKLKQLLESKSTIMLDKWQPTTKQCPVCGASNKLSLADRWYSCSCGFEDHRDYKSADTMLVMAGFIIPKYQLIN